MKFLIYIEMKQTRILTKIVFNKKKKGKQKRNEKKGKKSIKFHQFLRNLNLQILVFKINF